VPLSVRLHGNAEDDLPNAERDLPNAERDLPNTEHDRPFVCTFLCRPILKGHFHWEY